MSLKFYHKLRSLLYKLDSKLELKENELLANKIIHDKDFITSFKIKKAAFVGCTLYLYQEDVTNTFEYLYDKYFRQLNCIDMHVMEVDLERDLVGQIYAFDLEGNIISQTYVDEVEFNRRQAQECKSKGMSL